MVNKVINRVLLLVGFILLSALYYWQVILFDKPMIYGIQFGVARGILILCGFGYFLQVVNQTPFLNKIKQKLNLDPSARGRAGDAIAMTLGTIHMVAVYFGSVPINQFLLSTYGKLTKGVIVDCKFNKQGKQCLYQYVVNGKVFTQHVSNSKQYLKEQYKVTVVYFPKLPAISIIRS